MKKRLLALLAAAAMTTMLVACGDGNGADGGDTNNAGDTGNGAVADGGAADLGNITIVSREDGSGTRGAFVELAGILQDDADGNEMDMTTPDAVIMNGTDIVMSTVAGDPAAIGYISLGSLNDNIKGLEIDGVAASAENVKAGTYKLVRPFNMATKGEPTGLAADFISFIMSAEGQAIVTEGYISAVDNAPAFESSGATGKIVVGGSTSVGPLTEKLIEAYNAINPEGEIELQSGGSSVGMNSAIDGTFDIGLASRELKSEELAELSPIVMALDGIAVIVNKDNPLSGLTTEQVKQIYVGEITAWSGLE